MFSLDLVLPAVKENDGNAIDYVEELHLLICLQLRLSSSKNNNYYFSTACLGYTQVLQTANFCLAMWHVPCINLNYLRRFLTFCRPFLVSPKLSKTFCFKSILAVLFWGGWRMWMPFFKLHLDLKSKYFFV